MSTDAEGQTDSTSAQAAAAALIAHNLGQIAESIDYLARSLQEAADAITEALRGKEEDEEDQ